jgi:TRAP-type C4-dicarboxylate transport system substrate-binding protein
MPFNEVRPSLEGGKLGIVQNSFEALVSFRFQEVAKFVTVGGGYGTLTIFTPILISKAAWESLNEDEKQALEEAAAVSNIFFEASQREAHETAVEAFTKAGVKVEPLTFEDYASWLQIAKATVWKKYRSVSPRADELFDLMLKGFINSAKR